MPQSCAPICGVQCHHVLEWPQHLFTHLPLPNITAPTAPQTRLFSHRSIMPQLCHLVAQAYRFAWLPHSELPCGGVVWCGVGTLVHALAVSAVPRGMCLPVCTPVSSTVFVHRVQAVYMPALNHSSNIWPCRHSCLPFWYPGASVNSKGTPEHSCTAKCLRGHTHSCLLCPVLQHM